MPDLRYLGGFQMKSQPFDSIDFKELRSVSGRLNVTAPDSEAVAGVGVGVGAHVLFPKLKDAGAVHIDAGWDLYVAPHPPPLPPAIKFLHVFHRDLFYSG
jgi:hypothetical protein